MVKARELRGKSREELTEKVRVERGAGRRERERAGERPIERGKKTRSRRRRCTADPPGWLLAALVPVLWPGRVPA